MKNIQEAIESGLIKKSNWQEEAKFRADNRYWLKTSFAISLKLLQYSRLENISKEDIKTTLDINTDEIFRGSYNFTLMEIKNIEKLLNSQIIDL